MRSLPTPSTIARRLVRDPPFVVAASIGVLGLLPYTIGKARLPLGPDASVYLWWYRLTAVFGLSAVSHRPGALALSLTSGRMFGAGPAPSLIAIEVATAVGLSIGITILAMHAGVRSFAGQVAAGLVAGVMALGLSQGWISNATFGVCYLAAVVLLLRDDSRAWVGPGVALGAAGLAHPMFLVLGGTVLFGVAVLEWVRGMRSQAIQIVLSLVFGAALAGLGLAAVSIGSTWSGVPTSGDGLFRAAGLGTFLPERYREGFAVTWRGGLWLALPIPLLLLGLARGRGGRIAGVWTTTCLVGIPVLLVSGLAPATRLPQWAFPLPIFLALAWERAWRGGFPVLVRRTMGALVVAGLVALVVAAARVEPAFTSSERANIAATWATVRDLPADRPIVGFVGYEPIQPAIHVTEVWNELRATLPPDRSDDIFVFYGEPEDLRDGRMIQTGDAIDRALSRYTLTSIGAHGGTPADAGTGIHHNLEPGRPLGTSTGDPGEVLEPSTPLVSAGTALLVIAIWLAAGSTWVARAGIRTDRWATAFLLGAPALTWAGLVVDRVHLLLREPWVAGLALVLAATIGWGAGEADRRAAAPVAAPIQSHAAAPR